MAGLDAAHIPLTLPGGESIMFHRLLFAVVAALLSSPAFAEQPYWSQIEQPLNEFDGPPKKLSQHCFVPVYVATRFDERGDAVTDHAWVAVEGATPDDYLIDPKLAPGRFKPNLPGFHRLRNHYFTRADGQGFHAVIYQRNYQSPETDVHLAMTPDEHWRHMDRKKREREWQPVLIKPTYASGELRYDNVWVKRAGRWPRIEERLPESSHRDTLKQLKNDGFVVIQDWSYFAADGAKFHAIIAYEE
jgi:hypothetical protein